METLVSNAKHMPAPGDDTERASPCQIECQPQKNAIVSCVQSIRDGGSSDCMKEVVEEWTHCCASANMKAELETKVEAPSS